MEWITEPGVQTRLDRFLTDQLPDFSRSRLQRLIEEGYVTINGEPATAPKRTVLPGMRIVFTEPQPDPELPPADPYPLTIVHEDKDILVIDKPAGMITHPNTFSDKGTLVQAVLAIRPEIGEARYDAENPVSRLRPGVVHRLDRDTSGLIVMAKNRPALLNLAEQFHKRTVEKEYETLLYGKLEDEKTVDAPIHRKGGSDSSVMVASHDPEIGRHAVTHFRPLELMVPYPKWPKEQATKVRVKIETGRTHQIRVHAKFIGHPVLGDQLYTNKPATRLAERLGLTHQQLRSVKLVIKHPTTGKKLAFELT